MDVKTTKPISSISWNSLQYLVDRLEELRKAHLIAFWVLIQHHAEDDEKKDHIHFYIEPNRSIDTEELRENFIELVPNTKPLGVNKFQKSDFKNWLWYSVHDKAYLASKQQSRKYHYSVTDLISSNDEDLRQRIQENPRPESEQTRAYELIKQGYSNEEIRQIMNTPLRNMFYISQALNRMRYDETNRGNRQPTSEETQNKVEAEQTSSAAEADCDEWNDLPF